MTALNLRSLNARLTVAYMVTGYMRANTAKQAFADCASGNTLERLRFEYQVSGTDKPSHPYVDMWETIQKFYKSEGWSNLCDEELQELRQKAMAIGFTAKDGLKVPATDIHASVKQWSDNGWFRYEQRRNGRRTLARRGALIGLALFGVPAVNA